MNKKLFLTGLIILGLVTLLSSAGYGLPREVADDGGGQSGGGGGGCTNPPCESININILNVNRAPNAVDDSYTTYENTDLTVSAPGLLGNDTDPDNNPLTAIKLSDPYNGTLIAFNPDGSFLYRPNVVLSLPANGATSPEGILCYYDTFTYKVNDGTSDSNIATVNITINPPVDNPPVLDPISSQVMREAEVLSVNLSATDPDGDAITLSYTSNPAITFGAYTALDDFERATLGPNWTVARGTPQIYGNSDFGGSSVGGNDVLFTANGFPDNQYAECVISAISAGNEIGPTVRTTNSGGLISAYGIETDGTYAGINVVINGAWVSNVGGYWSAPLPQVGDTIRIEVEGSTIKSYLNGVLKSQGTDTRLTSGYPGLYVWAPSSVPTSRAESFVASGSALVDNGNGTGALTFSPGLNDAGVYALTVTAAAAGLTDSKSFSLTVNEANNCPGPVRLYDTADNLIDCFQQIQSAISDSRALNGYKIVVDPGTYFEHINFQGKALILKSTNPTNPDIVASTIINGSHNGRVVYIPDGSGPATKIEGFTITNGYLIDGASGAGILVGDSYLTLKNCVVRDNTVEMSGSGGGLATISQYDKDITIEYTTFFGNRAWRYGGGVSIYNTKTATIRNCNFNNNFLYSNETQFNPGGGGLYVYRATIENCTFNGNSSGFEGLGGGLSVGDDYGQSYVRDSEANSNSAGFGGGIYARGPVTIERTQAYNNFTQKEAAGIYYYKGIVPSGNGLALIDSLIHHNHVNVQGNGNKFAGGIEIIGGTNSITNSVIADNVAPAAGGGIYGAGGANVTINASTISNNQSMDLGSSFGGGIATYESTFTITNSVLTSNDSKDGGGIYAGDKSIINVSSSEISAGSAEKGGAIYARGSNEANKVQLNLTKVSIADNASSSTPMLHLGNGDFTINSAILWDNASTVIQQDNGATLTVKYSDIKGGWTGTGNINANPMFVNTAAGDYNLLSGSPCINTGDPALGAGTDMGAYPNDRPLTGPVNLYNAGESWVASFSTIQAAINSPLTLNGYKIVVSPGRYYENINFLGKAITLKSINPQDPATVASTIIDGGARNSVVRFEWGETSSSVLEGFTITNGFRSLDFGGGIRLTNNAEPTIRNCVITGNHVVGSGSFGGGIGNNGSSFGPTITNCIITGNSAFSGGGISSKWSGLTVSKCTVSGNSATKGGGFEIEESMNFPSIINSIFWGNSPNEVNLGTGGTIGITYSDIQGGYTGTGNINADPKFVNAAAGDYHLLAGSPCIDTGAAGADMGAYAYP